MSSGWDAIWEARGLDVSAGSMLQALMTAGGRDTEFGRVDEESWLTYVRRITTQLDLEPNSSVFEVGCGAGAFLYDLYRSGYQVSGIDRSTSLVSYARQTMPSGTFEVADAGELATFPPADAVVSCEAFLYFSSLPYADRVIGRMASKASHVVAVLGVPDAAKESEALARRRELAGGRDAYAARYRGLDHLYFDRDWLVSTLKNHGLVDVHVEDQEIEGYHNALYRFDCWGFVAREDGSRADRRR